MTALRSTYTLGFWLLSFCYACAACASSPGATPSGTHPAGKPALPSDALQLVSGEPDSLLMLQVEPLRDSPLFPLFKPYLESATCLSLADWQDLLQGSTRALLASRTEAREQTWLLVLDGKFTPETAQRLLKVVNARTTPAAQHAPLSDEKGSYGPLWTQGPLSVSVLEGRLLVLGTQAWVHTSLATLEQADKPGAASFSKSHMWLELAPQVQCAAHHACLLTVADNANAKPVQRLLARVGAGALGAQLAAAESAIALNAPDGATLAIVSSLASPEAAIIARDQLETLLGRAGLLIRLAALPNVFDDVHVSAQQHLLRAELAISAEDLRAYERRGRQLFGRMKSSCDTTHGTHDTHDTHGTHDSEPSEVLNL